MEKEELISKPHLVKALISQRQRHELDHKRMVLSGFIVIVLLIVAAFVIVAHAQAKYGEQKREDENNCAPDVTIPSMEFTVLNITKTRFSVNWNLLIRIPYQLPGFYTCLDGDLQFFIVYKGVTIATSIKSYNIRPWWPTLLKMALTASEEDVDGVIVKDVREFVKGRGEMLFGSRLLLPDCRYGTSGKMNYACDEATLRFRPGSQRNASLFGNQPTCHYCG